VLAERLASMLGPVSRVLDVGCGAGQILAGFRTAGTERVFGLESQNGVDWCKRLNIFELAETEYMPVDLRTSLPRLVDFDVVVCTEVGEHLPPEAANEMIRWMCVDVNPAWLVFSGAIPGGTGTAHINEQPTPVWMRFRKQKYSPRTTAPNTGARPRERCR